MNIREKKTVNHRFLSQKTISRYILFLTISERVINKWRHTHLHLFLALSTSWLNDTNLDHGWGHSKMTSHKIRYFSTHSSYNHREIHKWHHSYFILSPSRVLHILAFHLLCCRHKTIDPHLSLKNVMSLMGRPYVKIQQNKHR